jgi:hypothetical protein
VNSGVAPVGHQSIDHDHQRPFPRNGTFLAGGAPQMLAKPFVVGLKNGFLSADRAEPRPFSNQGHFRTPENKVAGEIRL